VEETRAEIMSYFITAKGKRLVVSATHELYAKCCLKTSLAKALKSHVRVAVHKDRLALETSQNVLTRKQKHELNLIYREHHCRGYASRIGNQHYESDYFKTVHKINYHKCMGKN
jgi:hypothetical protein